MYLSEQQVKEITRGTLDITCENGVYYFYRFSKWQMEVYKNTKADFKNIKNYKKTAGLSTRRDFKLLELLGN